VPPRLGVRSANTAGRVSLLASLVSSSFIRPAASSPRHGVHQVRGALRHARVQVTHPSRRANPFARSLAKRHSCASGVARGGRHSWMVAWVRVSCIDHARTRSLVQASFAPDPRDGFARAAGWASIRQSNIAASCPRSCSLAGHRALNPKIPRRVRGLAERTPSGWQGEAALSTLTDPIRLIAARDPPCSDQILRRDRLRTAAWCSHTSPDPCATAGCHTALSTQRRSTKRIDLWGGRRQVLTVG
jgi:hypothetical protein